MMASHGNFGVLVQDAPKSATFKAKGSVKFEEISLFLTGQMGIPKPPLSGHLSPTPPHQHALPLPNLFTLYLLFTHPTASLDAFCLAFITPALSSLAASSLPFSYHIWFHKKQTHIHSLFLIHHSFVHSDHNGQLFHTHYSHRRDNHHELSFILLNLSVLFSTSSRRLATSLRISSRAGWSAFGVPRVSFRNGRESATAFAIKRA